MFNFTVTVQERPNGSIYTQTIDVRSKRSRPTPGERRVADAIKKAVLMARVARTRPTKKPGDDVSYLDATAVFSDLEWALGLAAMSTGGPGLTDE